MFTIAGILADEEPKTPISPSGLYNSSETRSLDPEYYLDSDPLSGLSEFTFMLWAYISPTSPSYFFAPYQGYSEILRFTPIGITDSNVFSSMFNSNGGNTSVSSSTIVPQNEWNHFCLTGSLLDNKIRIYMNGVLLNEATMTYANTSTTSARFNDTNNLNIAQCNIYNRRLTDSEVAEHYVYDEDTSQSGVLAFDAMTTSQKSGLIYCSSLIEDISFSGNEFKDRSGNNITLSPQPSLTGQQIYVYTDASDLPSDGTNVFSAKLNGVNQYFNMSNGLLDLGFQAKWAFGIRFKLDTTSRDQTIINLTQSNRPNEKPLWVRIQSDGLLHIRTQGDNTPNTIEWTSTQRYDDGEWHSVIAAFKQINGIATYYVDGINVNSGVYFNDLKPYYFSIGALYNDVIPLSEFYDGFLADFFYYDSRTEGVFTQADVDNVYGSSLTTVVDYNSIPAVTQARINRFYQLYNTTTDSGLELEDKGGGVSNISDVGNIPFVLSGLYKDI